MSDAGPGGIPHALGSAGSRSDWIRSGVAATGADLDFGEVRFSKLVLLVPIYSQRDGSRRHEAESLGAAGEIRFECVALLRSTVVGRS